MFPFEITNGSIFREQESEIKELNNGIVYFNGYTWGVGGSTAEVLSTKEEKNR